MKQICGNIHHHQHPISLHRRIEASVLREDSSKSPAFDSVFPIETDTKMQTSIGNNVVQVAQVQIIAVPDLLLRVKFIHRYIG